MLFEKYYIEKIKTGTSILSGEIPITQFAGKTYSWRDFEIGNLTCSGVSDASDEDFYVFNSSGYRCPEFDSPRSELNVVSLGCSETFGIGVIPENRFSGVFCELLRQSTGREVIDWNMGVPAKSNDFISRCLPGALKTIRPDVVLICFTYICRREFQDASGASYNFLCGVPRHLIPDHMSAYWDGHLALNNFPNNFTNLARNFHSVKTLLAETKTPWVYSFMTDEFKAPILHESNCVGFFSHIDYASDGMHAGPKSHHRLAHKMFHKYNALSSK